MKSEILKELISTSQEEGSLSFGDFPDSYKKYDDSQIVLLPVPYDKTSTYSKGSDLGPEALIDASEQLEVYDIETASEVYKNGIATLASMVVDDEPEILYECVKDVTGALFDDSKFPVLIGGEHSITPGAVAAASKRFENLTVLQLDAHGDTRESYMGSRFNHACVMARVREICPAVQVGIRSIDTSEVNAMDMERVVFAHEICQSQSDKTWHDRVSSLLSDNVYVTIDLDCFDPSIIPSTGTPEPGGLDWYHVTGLLRQVSRKHRIVGFDVVELLPRQSNPAPDFIAAKLVYQFLSYIFEAV